MAEGDSWMFRAPEEAMWTRRTYGAQQREPFQPYSAMMHGLFPAGHPFPAFPGEPGGLSPECGGTDSRRGKEGCLPHGQDGHGGRTPIPAPFPVDDRKRQERSAPEPSTVNPEAVKFWEQAAELGSLTPGRTGRLLRNRGLQRAGPGPNASSFRPPP